MPYLPREKMNSVAGAFAAQLIYKSLVTLPETVIKLLQFARQLHEG
jgi:hypothetical protein